MKYYLEILIALLLMVVMSGCRDVDHVADITDSDTVIEALIIDTVSNTMSPEWQLIEAEYYESLQDSFLKKVLEKYFVLDDERGYPVYDFVPEDEIAKDNRLLYNIVFRSKEFDSANHKVVRDEQGFIYRIDGRHYWGSDGEMPKEEISEFAVKYKSEILLLPDSSYKDLYNPGGAPNAIFVRNGDDDYFIPILQASDGAGAYTAAWIFKNGKYIRRVVDPVQ